MQPNPNEDSQTPSVDQSQPQVDSFQPGTNPESSAPQPQSVIAPDFVSAPTEFNPDTTPLVPQSVINTVAVPAAEVAPATTPEVAFTPLTAPAPLAVKTGFLSKFRSKKLLAAAVFLPLLLIGAAAGAYYGVILPNKPENVLLTAVGNTLQQEQIHFEGTLEASAADATKPDAMAAMKVDFKGQADIAAEKTALTADVTVSGVKVQGEVRFVDKSLFVKLGDLSTVRELVGVYAQGLDPIIDKVQNQWIEVDSTLLQQAGANCAVDSKIVFTDADLKVLLDEYQKNPFMIIGSTKDEQVNGNDATKFELEINDNKLGEYTKVLDQISFVKKLKECNKDLKSEDIAKQLADGDTTPLTLWVDKSSKRIVKLESRSTEQDATKENIKGSLSVTLKYEAVKVEKPSDAKPLMSLFSELQSMEGGSSTLPSNGLQLNNTLNLL